MNNNNLPYAGGRAAARKTILFTPALTLDEVADRCCRNASRSTRDIARALLRHAEACAGHPVTVQECSYAFCRRLALHMHRQGLSDGTLRTYLERLGTLLRHVQPPRGRRKGRRWNAPDISPLLPPRPKSHKGVLTAEEARRLRQATAADNACASTLRAFLFSLQTALRFSDIAQLDWSHIFRDETGFCLRKPMQKTGQVIEIQLTGQACALLSEQLASRDMEQRPAKGLVFSSLPSYSTVRRQLKRAGVEAGCSTPNLTFHVARHTFASELCRHSIPLATISHFLGHSSLAVTEGYIHSFQQDERRALALMNAF